MAVTKISHMTIEFLEGTKKATKHVLTFGICGLRGTIRTRVSYRV